MTQLEEQMADLTLRSGQIREYLKNVNDGLQRLSTNNFGLLEDQNFLIPNKPSVGLVDQLRLAKSRKRLEVQDVLNRLQKDLVTLERRIREEQKAKYRHLVTKRRYEEVTRAKKEELFERREKLEAKRVREQALLANKRPRLEDLQAAVSDEDTPFDDVDLR